MKAAGKTPETLFAIVGHRQGFHSGPYLSAVFDAQGPVAKALCVQFYFKIKGTSPQILGPGQIGPFASCEEIEDWCLQLAEELGVQQINLLDVSEYAAIVSSVGHMGDLRRELALKGKILHRNPSPARSRFLDKLFS